jgi:hypothetical protein
LIDVSWFPLAVRTMATLRSGRSLRLAVVAILGIIWACSTSPPTAPVHAIILESAPAQGSTGPSPRRREKPLCSVQLIGSRQRSVAPLRQEADAPPDTLTYPLPALAPGEYQARWKVMAADGHITEGTVAFTVAAS